MDIAEGNKGWGFMADELLQTWHIKAHFAWHIFLPHSLTFYPVIEICSAIKLLSTHTSPLIHLHLHISTQHLHSHISTHTSPPTHLHPHISTHTSLPTHSLCISFHSHLVTTPPLLDYTPSSSLLDYTPS